jgi:hypothetical protein
MPKAAMHKYCRSVAWKHHIRVTRQVAAMQAISVSHGVNHAAHDQFGLGIPVSDQRHS